MGNSANLISYIIAKYKINHKTTKPPIVFFTESATVLTFQCMHKTPKHFLICLTLCLMTLPMTPASSHFRQHNSLFATTADSHNHTSQPHLLTIYFASKYTFVQIPHISLPIHCTATYEICFKSCHPTIQYKN